MSFLDKFKRKPKVDQIAMGSAPFRQDPVPSDTQSEVSPQLSADGSVVISTIADIPPGRLESWDGGDYELPVKRRSDFAFIKTGPKSLVVLVTPEQVGTSLMYDVIRRVQDGNPDLKYIVQRATQDIISLLYEKFTQVSLTNEDQTSIERLIQRLVDMADAMRASDIHIETRTTHADILLRIDGVFQFYSNITRDTAEALGTVLYNVHADSDSKETSWNIGDVSDGAIEWTTSSSKKLQLRFSSSPIFPSGNFQIVIRLLTLETKTLTLAQLGYSALQEDYLDQMMSGSGGIVLLCGPTNSGKSTTLKTVIQRLYVKCDKKIKIITVEDPVEYIIEGACQIPVARKRSSLQDQQTGSVFTTLLRGTLRQDPDVVLVGEIRDLEAAIVTKDLVLAGRKVFATLHATSAMWAFFRLREIGLPWDILTMPGLIAGVVYQRLLPLLCTHCSVPVLEAGDRVSPQLLDRLRYVADFQVDNVRVHGAGCDHCNQRGYSGRTPLSEFLVPDRKFLKLMALGRHLEAEEHWRNITGGAWAPVTSLQHAIIKMKAGMVSPLDIESQIDRVNNIFTIGDPLTDNITIEAADAPVF